MKAAMTPFRFTFTRSFAIASLLIVACGHAWADSASIAANALGALDTLFKEFENGINTFTDATAFSGLGKKIAFVLFAVVFVWGVLRNMVLGKGFMQVVPDLIQPLLLLGITVYGIDHGFGRAIRDSVLGLADQFASMAGLPGINGLEVSLIKAFAKTAFSLVDLDIYSDSGAPQASDGVLAKLWHAVEGWSSSVITFILGWIARLVGAFFLLVAGAVAAGVVLVAKVSIALGMALAPVMMPWGIWRPTEFLLSSWIKHVVTGSMQVVVAAAIGGMVMNAATKLVAVAATFNSNEASIALALIVALFGALAIYLMLKVPDLAGGLVSGDGTIGIQGWSRGAAGAAGSALNLGGKAAAGGMAAGKAAGSLGRAAIGGTAAGAAAARAFRGGSGLVDSAKAAAEAYKTNTPGSLARQAANSLVQKLDSGVQGSRASARARAQGSAAVQSMASQLGGATPVVPSGRPAASDQGARATQSVVSHLTSAAAARSDGAVHSSQ